MGNNANIPLTDCTNITLSMIRSRADTQKPHVLLRSSPTKATTLKLV